MLQSSLLVLQADLLFLAPSAQLQEISVVSSGRCVIPRATRSSYRATNTHSRVAVGLMHDS